MKLGLDLGYWGMSPRASANRAAGATAARAGQVGGGDADNSALTRQKVRHTISPYAATPSGRLRTAEIAARALQQSGVGT